MPTELFTQRRDHLGTEGLLLAGAEPGEQRQRDHRRRYVQANRLLKRSFAMKFGGMETTALQRHCIHRRTSRESDLPVICSLWMRLPRRLVADAQIADGRAIRGRHEDRLVCGAPTRTN